MHIEGNLQWDDVGGETVRHGSDVLAQGIIFGAGTSPGASGLPHSPPVGQSQADSGHPNQERPPSPSSLRPVRVSHSFLSRSGVQLLLHMQLLAQSSANRNAEFIKQEKVFLVK